MSNTKYYVLHVTKGKDEVIQMGLIKAAIGAAGGTLADQWKEFFYCDSLSSDVMVVKGQKRVGGRSSNTKGNDNIISNGSGIAVFYGNAFPVPTGDGFLKRLQINLTVKEWKVK